MELKRNTLISLFYASTSQIPVKIIVKWFAFQLLLILLFIGGVERNPGSEIKSTPSSNRIRMAISSTYK